MIHIYNNSNKDYESNGNMILKPSSCRMSVKLNEKNDIEIEHDFDNEERWRYIQPESVIKVPTPEGKYNLYQIYEVEKDMDCVRAYARHIFFNLSKRVLIDCRPTNANGQQTLEKILEGTEFKGHSDITATNTSHYVRKTILNALVSDDENSFFTKFGGELYLDNFDIYINSRIGSDTNIKFEYGKDITNLEDGINTDETFTRLIPVAFEGRTIPENYVNSPYIDKYKDIKETTVSFDNYKLKEDFDEGEEPSETDIVFNTKEELYDALRKACNNLFKGGIDRPTLNTALEIATLENTVEYKDFKNILQVSLGDRVTAYYKPLDLDIYTRVVGYEFDCISKEYISIELGETVKDFMDFNVDANNKINSILNSNNTVNAASIEGIINAFNTKFKAQRDIAQNQHVRAMLFEDLDSNSPTYGAMCIGSMGFEIASKRTLDGKHWDWSTFGSGQGFVADHIVAGILSTILIQNADGSLQIDLSSNNGIMTKQNGKNAIELAGTILKFYDWDGEGNSIGQLYSTRSDGEATKPGIALGHSINSHFSIVYQEGNTYYPYVTFDNSSVTSYNNKAVHQIPILVHEPIHMNSNPIYYGDLMSLDKLNWVSVMDDGVSITYKDKHILLNDTGIHIQGDVRFYGTITDKNGNEILGGGTGGGSGGSSGDWENSKISAKCFRFIKGMEGFAPRHYTDPGGYATIGYGVAKVGNPTLYAQLVSEEPLSEERAAKVAYDLKNNDYGKVILNACKSMGVTKQCQFDALVSLAYNSGTGSVTGSNTLTNAIRRDINDEAYIRPIWENFKITSGGQVLEGLKILRRNQCNMFFNKSFEIRSIPIINSSGGISGTVTENNGDGWLPVDEIINNAPKIQNAHGTFTCPTYGRVTAGYPYYPSGGNHNGVDIANSAGTPIYAMRSGTVSKAGLYTGGGMETYGNVVYIEHEDGIQTRYAHNSSILVKVGDVVKEGQQISKMGTTGNSTGNHLHFEVLKNGVRTHPAPSMKVGDTINKFTP